ncbi:MAG: FecR family protein [Methylococcaceae bacterium]|nr:FecR family protein [Methylococcaceae bacterium]
MFSAASAWFFRLRADDVVSDEHDAFVAWLASNPAHAEAWDEVQKLFAELDSPAKRIRQQQRLAAAHSSPAKITEAVPKPRRLFYPTSAAALACVALALMFIQPAWLQNLHSDYHTAIGEQRRIELADGSTVLLNTDSAIAVDLQADQRRVQLLRGEAFFQVAHASQRPFRVVAGDTQARVTGTAFSVNRDNSEVTVTVSEGRVETSRPENPDPVIALTPGQSAVYADQQPAVVQAVDTNRSLAWRQGQMVFVQAPLAEVVEQINRYRPGRLIITDPQLENRPITAVFSVNHLDDAVTALERTLGIQARRLTDYLVLLG